MDTLTLLDSERAALMARVARVPEADRARRPAPDRWSVAEVLEHLAMVERGIARLIAKRGREAPAADRPSAQPLDAARIALVRDRARRLEVPEFVRPSSSVTYADAARALEETRARLRQAVLDADPASLDGCVHPHPVLGPLTLRDWVCFVAHHEARHAAQVEEIARSCSEEATER